MNQSGPISPSIFSAINLQAHVGRVKIDTVGGRGRQPKRSLYRYPETLYRYPERL